MKQQINVINIGGAVVSAGLLVFSHFSFVRDAVSKALKRDTPQISNNVSLAKASLGSQNNLKIQMPAATLTTPIKTSVINQVEKSPQQTTVLKAEKQEPECKQITTKSQQIPSKTNGCPRNLNYFTQKPRPKQTPQECFTCKNLITCVCQTGK